jgi:pyruvate ferredoxin oxidoreductase alpha subunit
MGTLGLPDIYNEAKKAVDEAMINSKKVILEVWKEWEQMFGRKYEPIMSYKANDADVLMMTMGSMGETAQVAVDELRKEGFKAGLLDLKLFRPFPVDDLKKAVKGIKNLIVIDRAVMHGGPSAPVCAEVKSVLYDDPDRPVITNDIIGLGGRDVRVEDFKNIFKKAAKGKPARAYEIYGVRG